MTMAEAIAFCGLMCAIIAIAGILLEAHNRRLKNRERELELRVRLAETESKRGEAALPRIEERLRVLERITTDPAHGLSTEIEQLRHSRQPESAS